MEALISAGFVVGTLALGAKGLVSGAVSDTAPSGTIPLGYNCLSSAGACSRVGVYTVPLGP